MITFRYKNTNAEPKYMTRYSAACDLYASETVVIKSFERKKVSTGVWIDKVNWEDVPEGTVPEIQIRARSGLAIKHGICLANGVGTIDADFPDEICILLLNTSKQDFTVEKGSRIAQMLLSLSYRFPHIPIGGERKGGFGSTKL